MPNLCINNIDHMKVNETTTIPDIRVDDLFKKKTKRYSNLTCA